MMVIAERDDPTAIPATAPTVGCFFECDDEDVGLDTGSNDAGVDEEDCEQEAICCCQTLSSLHRAGVNVEDWTDHQHNYEKTSVEVSRR